MSKSAQHKYNYGAILPIAMVLSLMGLSVVYGYFKWLGDKKYQLRYRIAKTKALYNAETGMAEKAYPELFAIGFEAGTLNGKEVSKEMGYYEDPILSFARGGTRVAQVTGVHEIRNSNGKKIPVKATIQLPAKPKTLGIYMYLTDSEEAGGAPFVFDSPGNRREVSFKDDVLDGIIQTNGTLHMSDYGCPDFSDATVYLTTGSQMLDLGNCGSWNQLFGGMPDTMSKPPVNLPPSGYETMKKNYTFMFDATLKINNSALKDTLIMTDIEFFENGSFHVKQWWYLMPPHFVPGIPAASMALGDPLYLEGADIDGNGMISAFECSDTDDLRTCESYNDSLRAYHAKYALSSGEDAYFNSTISSSHGFAHYDFEILNALGAVDPAADILTDMTIDANRDVVIYVKGGPVRVKGVYKGSYSIVTDEYVVYRRHATKWLFGAQNMVPRDTVWGNIWLTGDIINADAFPSGNMAPYQPDESCEEDDGSKNILGLVSGANVIIANSRANGARNGMWDDDIIINAGIIALNESFVMHYWQNTLSGAQGQYSDPPYGDGRGVGRFGGSGGADNRGTIHFWGSLVQKFRGYMQRNQPGPYNIAAPGIGMDKDYHYDRNMDCTPPPFYPAVEYSGTEEIDVSITDYRKVRN
tara:strand:+ start:923 stop:2842 length:1920 start_codon:yes stop_codon:yes gene_type:complete